MSVLRVWLIPLAAMALFLGFLLNFIPYSAGYGWAKIPLGSLIWQMWAIPDWEHAMLVPFICLFLVFLQKDKILQAPVHGSNWAAGLILLGTFIYWIGLKAEMQYFAFLAVQILIAGLIIWFWGTKVFSLVGFAWLFLLFAWPLPFLDSVVALPLRLVMSHISSDVLNLIGVASIRSGTAILSAADPGARLETGDKFQIDIADPCSGLHSLFALMMFSALAGYICVDKTGPRLIVFLASIPLAIIGNVTRIVLLALATEHFGASFSLGTEENPTWFHMGCGYLVYVVALVLLIALINLLNSKWLGWASYEKTPSGSLAPSET
ncbi:exosortase/archaeosortase family protein [Methylacidiphilales bacterium]|nr:exosortase/archaeosortase family protein [Candidatus Methylacidiphilales bacterium]MDB4793483.1 exosortase/archaeosortase family protein [Candidatus Methylacidiphilales bacterium]